MREFKFRAWDENDKKMLDILELTWHIDDITYEKKLSFMEYWNDVLTKFIRIYPTNIILLQYTGIKDKNRREIYEGDIFSDGSVCQYLLSSFRKIWKDGKNEDLDLSENPIDEVVGNIYENPELCE